MRFAFAWVVRCSIAICLLWGTVLVAVRLGQTSFPTEEMAYTARLGDNSEIYVMDLRRRLPQNLTKTRYWNTRQRFESQDQAPDWSPDGRWIVFQSNRTGGDDIYLMDASGANLRRLTTHRGIDSHPAWSPDGRAIVYQSFQNGNFEIMQLDLTAEVLQPVRLTQTDRSERHPGWSPDGTQIIFSTDAYNLLDRFELYTMNTDGTNVQRLYTGSDDLSAMHPVWSPDGAFYSFSGLQNNRSSVFVVSADARTGGTRIAGGDRTADAYMPGWAPDARALYYVTAINGRSQIFRQPLYDGQATGAPQRLTQTRHMVIQPALKPTMP